ncbi:MAG: putative DNA-binding protein (MmcQ/YjbR family) [Planctomycetota bacterium]|jgi:predicted DNA-binding protein (MmcQ/YjbR family)
MSPSKKTSWSPKHSYESLRDFALGFPDAYEEFPWGHSAIKVRKKIFLSMSDQEDLFSMSVKLPESNFEALLLPFTEPTRYGLGKHGWVSARFGGMGMPPLELMREWIVESYRATAPKGLVKILLKQDSAAKATATTSASPAATKVPSKKKSRKKQAKAGKRKKVARSAASVKKKKMASKKSAKSVTKVAKVTLRKASKKKAGSGLKKTTTISGGSGASTRSSALDKTR